MGTGRGGAGAEAAEPQSQGERFAAARLVQRERGWGDWEGAGTGVVCSFQRDSLHGLGVELIPKRRA